MLLLQILQARQEATVWHLQTRTDLSLERILDMLEHVWNMFKFTFQYIQYFSYVTHCHAFRTHFLVHILRIVTHTNLAATCHMPRSSDLYGRADGCWRCERRRSRRSRPGQGFVGWPRAVIAMCSTPGRGFRGLPQGASMLCPDVSIMCFYCEIH